MQTCVISSFARTRSASEMLCGIGLPSFSMVRIIGFFWVVPIARMNINIQNSLIQNNPFFDIFMFGEQILPNFILTSEHSKHRVTVMLKGEAGSLPKQLQEEFNEKNYVVDGHHTFITDKHVKKYSLPQQCSVQYSSGVQKLANYEGVASTLLASAYNFNWKTAPKPIVCIGINPATTQAQKIINLALATIKSQALANGRGDIFGSPDYFVQKAEQLASQRKLSINILRGQQLLAQGLTLFHAVGRASSKEPALINIGYKGDAKSDSWIAFIGKGVCFDSGGLDLKTASGLKPMFLDKSGACSCFAAFEQIVKEQLKINVTITLGMVENFIGKNSYRPSDIIKSKKGYTVEIADTDAQGRLVLADCMTWTQHNYKISKIVELSTLTYSCVTALGHNRAGLFGNSQTFLQLLKSTGEEVNELSWILPLDESHFELLSSNSADFLSDANETAPGASIAAAFLQKFVEEGVEWIHVDVGGTCINLQENKGTGYGARLLLQLARKLAI